MGRRIKERGSERGGFSAVARNLAVAAGIMLAAAAVGFALTCVDGIEYVDLSVSMLFLLAVFLTARFTDGYGYGIAASLLSVLAVNYVFTYPYFAFNFSLPGYPITILCMLAVSVCTSALTTRIKEVEQIRSEAEREKLRGNLLRAVSHDIRTPLTTILGANSVLTETGPQLSEAQRLELHGQIADDAQWLIRMVENLLTITRMQSDGSGRLIKTPELVEEVLAESAEKFRRRFPNQRVSVRAPEEPLLCPMDAMLVEQVLLNLLENVAIHAGDQTQAELSATALDGAVRFTVDDDGCGVPRWKLATLFTEPACAEGGDDKRNMGIGLSVCRAIILAHGGEMEAHNRKPCGLSVSFTLPMEEE